MSVTPTVADWGGTSRFVDLGGPVHYVEFGGPAAGPRILLVHGLGGSHLNWCLLAGRLVPHARVTAVDLAGFGLTNPAGRACTVAANTALLHRFVSEVMGEPVILVGNSMGGMISIHEAAAHPDDIAGLVLIDPALPPAVGVLPDPLVAATFAGYAMPWLGEWFMARGRARSTALDQVQRVYRLCCVDPSLIPTELITASVALLERRARVPGLDTAFLAAARSVLRTSARRNQYFATMRAVRAPVLVIHGESDRLVSIKTAQAAVARNPAWELVTLPNVGHVPQLEDPDTVATHLRTWLTRHARTPDPT